MAIVRVSVINDACSEENKELGPPPPYSPPELDENERESKFEKMIIPQLKTILKHHNVSFSDSVNKCLKHKEFVDLLMRKCIDPDLSFVSEMTDYHLYTIYQLIAICKFRSIKKYSGKDKASLLAYVIQSVQR